MLFPAITTAMMPSTASPASVMMNPSSAVGAWVPAC